ncbi:MAG TPA: carbamoyltransferase C-terminal domain-containing protein [Candidatus Bathyarchaeia archaeon]|nr:carbamoyltransferase C-terminal domain-containing protein [Candidatus Bathyarchaeia archaeon]
MIILGIHPGHNCTACLMKDGKILAAISEERLIRIKNAEGYPRNAIDYCLKTIGISAKEIDLVAISSLQMWLEGSSKWITETQGSSVKSFTEYPMRRSTLGRLKILCGRAGYYAYNLPLSWNYVGPLWREIIRASLSIRAGRSVFSEPLKAWDGESQPGCILAVASTKDRRLQVTEHLGIDEQKIIFVEHHKAHAYYAYFGSPFRNRKVLILTADGVGDHINATVSLADEQGNIRRISHSYNLNSIGRVYGFVTRALGMKELEHEYKVMGLAPYAKDADIDRVYPVFQETLRVEGLEFIEPDRPIPFAMSPGFRILKYRFDWIAGAVQRFAEKLLAQWVTNAVKATGTSIITFSGGVSMNVKANMIISELPEVEDFFICPSGGDETTAIGSVYAAMADFCEAQGISKETICPLQNMYLGTEYTSPEIEQAIAEANLGNEFSIIRDEKNIPEKIAQELVNGKTVARFCGRMEFGARALGNRSILADPSNHEVVRRINEQVKNRDFWMPFAPTILSESLQNYVINPKKLKAPFMTICFHSTDQGRKHLAAGLHPYDFTLRPQVLSKEENPGYYEVIKNFQKLTGIGAVLNTSFNLHGEPIVCSPKDAIHTLQKSQIDMLVLEDILIKRN